MQESNDCHGQYQAKMGCCIYYAAINNDKLCGGRNEEKINVKQGAQHTLKPSISF